MDVTTNNSSSAHSKDPRLVVYVVDEDRSVRKSIRSLLGTIGVKVVDFATAEEFLAEFSPTLTLCVVAEVNMSGMGGIELLKELNTRRLKLPVILLSRRSEVATAVGAMKAGAIEYIEKPFVDRILLRTIQKLHSSDKAAT